jgi:uncharacterized iron-regulated membrane protein
LDTAGKRAGAVRRSLVWLHRVVGLAMAGFLLVAGLTGALLVWYEELDAAVNPHLFRVMPPAPGAVPLDVLTLRETAARQTGEAIRYFSLRPLTPGHSAVFRLDKAEAEDVFVDPYTGRVLGRRTWGDIGQGLTNLMPFVYRLHHSLALGAAGEYLLGIVALLWTMDCFVGAWLTCPAPQRHKARHPARPWLRRWWPSWKLRWDGGSYKLNFDLHRAGGLWPWAMLLALAWSSVAFNLSTVYDPVMRTLFMHQPQPARLASRKPNPHPVLGWQQARETGRRLMAEQAHRHGFTILAESWFVHEPTFNLYLYDVRSNLDVDERRGKTRLYFDADSGALLHLDLPTGQAPGDTITTWLKSLHRVRPWGLPFKVFMTGVGLVVVVLGVTGVIIWWKKRRARRKSAALRRMAVRPQHR